MKTLIYNGKLVLEDGIVENGYLIIHEDEIIEVGKPPSLGKSLEEFQEIIDGENMYVLPGIIDIHSDAIEREMEPRPNTLLPFKFSFYELEKKLAACGITTMFHSLSLGEGVGVRSIDRVLELVEELTTFINNKRSCINHKIHLRYEILYLEGIKIILNLLKEEKIHYLSLMDHSPGQGQYKKADSYALYAKEVWGMDDASIDKFLNQLKDLHDEVDWKVLAQIVGLAHEKGINVASHDDDTIEKIDLLFNMGVKVSEFPINLETAKYAVQKDMLTCVGAPNIIRGGSHNNNLKAMDAITNHGAHIVCSDYIPASMLQALFIVGEAIQDISAAAALFTINPAKAVGIDKERGSIKAGKKADIILVELYDDHPITRKTLCDGKIVYQNNYK